jgi:hypothetical protein
MKPHFKRQYGLWFCIGNGIAGAGSSVAECWANYQKGCAIMASSFAELCAPCTVH